jgi:hypothetical protein
LLPPLLFVLPLFLSDSIANPGRQNERSSHRVKVLDASCLRQPVHGKSGPVSGRFEAKVKDLAHASGAKQRTSRPEKLVEVPRVKSAEKAVEGGTR